MPQSEEMEEINLIALPDSTEKLRNWISDLAGQLEVREILFKAKNLLGQEIPHHVKYNRVRGVLKFIHGPLSEEHEKERRRVSLYNLDRVSKAILIKGIPGFIKAHNLSGVLSSDIGEFIQRTISDTTGIRIRMANVNRPPKRLKVQSVRSHAARPKRRAATTQIHRTNAPSQGVAADSGSRQDVPHPSAWRTWYQEVAAVVANEQYIHGPSISDPQAGWFSRDLLEGQVSNVSGVEDQPPANAFDFMDDDSRAGWFGRNLTGHLASQDTGGWHDGETDRRIQHLAESALLPSNNEIVSPIVSLGGNEPHWSIGMDSSQGSVSMQPLMGGSNSQHGIDL